MNQIFIIIQNIGDISIIIDEAYTDYKIANNKANELKNISIKKGYTEFTFNVKSLDIVYK